MAVAMDASLPIDLESLEDLFREAAVTDYLESFKSLTGATEVSDLLESSDEELKGWLEEIHMKPMLKNRLMRHLIKLKTMQAELTTSPGVISGGGPPLRAESMGSPVGSSAQSNNRVKHGEWKKGEKIGQGAFGLVFKGLNTLNGEIIAIKELNYDADKAKQLKEMIKEVKLMRRLFHPNIVTYLGGQEDVTEGRLYIFTEYVAGGSVESLLKQYGSFSEGVVRRYATETLEGLAYLHKEGILHRDIKPANVLVSQSGVAKLADFGASQFKPGGEGDGELESTRGDQTNTLAGTPYFMSPEAICQKAAGRRADVWSYGGFVQQMCTGQAPWRCLKLRGQFALFTHINESQNESPLECEERVMNGGKPFVSAELRCFLVRCFIRDYTKRPHAVDLLSDPFLEALSDDGSDDELGQTTQGIEQLLEKKESGNNTRPPLPPANVLPAISEKTPETTTQKSPISPAMTGSPGKKTNPFKKKKSTDSVGLAPSAGSAESIPSTTSTSGSKEVNPFKKNKAKVEPPTEAFTEQMNSSDVVNVASVQPQQSVEYAEVPKPSEEDDEDEDAKADTQLVASFFGGGDDDDEDDDSDEDDKKVTAETNIKEPKIGEQIVEKEEEQEEEEEEEQEEEEEEELMLDIDEAHMRGIISATEYHILGVHGILSVNPKQLPSMLGR